MLSNQKLWLLLFAAALLVIGGSLLGWQSVALVFDRETLIQFFSQTGEQSVGEAALGVGLFLVTHVIANAIGLPGTALVVVGGACQILCAGHAD